MQTRRALPADVASVLALNEESAHFLSPLTLARLLVLTSQAEAHWVVEDEGSIVAFLLAFREASAYDSVNYQWFAARYPSFLYIDRVVVSRAAQGRGLGTLLYRTVFAHAKASSVPLIACEFDIEPPNPVSASFHAKLGFKEVGQQLAGGGKKLVSLQVAAVHHQNEIPPWVAPGSPAVACEIER